MMVTPQGTLVEEERIIRQPQEETITTTQPNWVPDRFLAPGVTIQIRRRTREQLLQGTERNNLLENDEAQLEEDQALIPFDERMDGVDNFRLPEGHTGNPSVPEVESQGHVLGLEEQVAIETIELELQTLIAQLEQPLLSSTEDNIVTV